MICLRFFVSRECRQGFEVRDRKHGQGDVSCKRFLVPIVACRALTLRLESCILSPASELLRRSWCKLFFYVHPVTMLAMAYCQNVLCAPKSKAVQLQCCRFSHVTPRSSISILLAPNRIELRSRVSLQALKISS